MKEEWKKIVIDGRETYYSISNFGRVRNDSRGTFLKGSEGNTGYQMVHLRYSIDKKCSVHRLVMKAFCPREDCDELQINHIDGNKMNNRLDNLEWSTALENMRHSFENGLQKEYVGRIYQYDLEGNFISSFYNAVECAKQLGIESNLASIYKCVHGESSRVHQWQFRTFKKDKIEPWYQYRKGKEVFLYDEKTGKFINTFVSVIEAADKIGINKKVIYYHLKSKKPYKGFVFSYEPL